MDEQIWTGRRKQRFQDSLESQLWKIHEDSWSPLKGMEEFSSRKVYGKVLASQAIWLRSWMAYASLYIYIETTSKPHVPCAGDRAVLGKKEKTLVRAFITLWYSSIAMENNMKIQQLFDLKYVLLDNGNLYGICIGISVWRITFVWRLSRFQCLFCLIFNSKRVNCFISDRIWFGSTSAGPGFTRKSWGRSLTEFRLHDECNTQSCNC